MITTPYANSHFDGPDSWTIVIHDNHSFKWFLILIIFYWNSPDYLGISQNRIQLQNGKC